MSETTVATVTPSASGVTFPTDITSAAAITIDSYDVNPFAIACCTMLSVSQLMQEVLSLQYKAMQRCSDRARSTKDMANRMDEIIANISKKDEKETARVPKEVVDYMRDNGIMVGGKTIDDYLKNHNQGNLSKGELAFVQASLDNSFNADTDLLKQKQIMFEKYSNTYNAMLEGAKSCIDKWGRLLNDIIRG